MNHTTASGERELDVLVQSMNPVLHPDTFVFVTGREWAAADQHDAIMRFQEREGTTLIVPIAHARQQALAYEFPCRMITLNVHSSLDAIGFLARITRRLAALDMGVNPVSAFYHDHLFVPVDRADEALADLHAMIAEAG